MHRTILMVFCCAAVAGCGREMKQPDKAEASRGEVSDSAGESSKRQRTKDPENSITELPSHAKRFLFAEYTCGAWITAENQLRVQFVADRQNNPAPHVSGSVTFSPRNETVTLQQGDGTYVWASLPADVAFPVQARFQLFYKGIAHRETLTLKKSTFGGDKSAEELAGEIKAQEAQTTTAQPAPSPTPRTIESAGKGLQQLLQKHEQTAAPGFDLNELENMRAEVNTLINLKLLNNPEAREQLENLGNEMLETLAIAQNSKDIGVFQALMRDGQTTLSKMTELLESE